MKSKTYKLGTMGTFPWISIDFDNKKLIVQEKAFSEHNIPITKSLSLSDKRELNLSGITLLIYNNGNHIESIPEIFESEKFDQMYMIINKLIAGEEIDPALLVDPPKPKTSLGQYVAIIFIGFIFVMILLALATK